MARLAPLMVDRHLYPRAKVARAFWWTGEHNFGDLITPYLLRRAGVAPLLKPARAADIVAVGSILEILPESFGGSIWGSGKMHELVATSLPNAHIAAVRGRLTRDLLGCPEDLPLGDPGLLMGHGTEKTTPRGHIGVVAHFKHRGHPWFHHLLASDASVKDITVHADPDMVTAQIAGCRAVITTSLHGLIVADAVGVPAVWALPEPVLDGGDFKFRDHESVVNPTGVDRRVVLDESSDPRSLVENAWTPDRAVIDEARAGLLAALGDVIDRLPGAPRSPLMLPLQQFRA